MPPLPPLPPPPPAIHAPAPVQTVNTATQAMGGTTSMTLRAQRPALDMHNDPAYRGVHYRFEHIKHWKGKASASQRIRSNKRKAAKRAKR